MYAPLRNIRAPVVPEHPLNIPNSPARSGAIVLIATMLLSGLAGGAACCLLALMGQWDPVWMMLPIALAIGAFMRWQQFTGALGSIAAASAMLISVAYAEYLYAAVRMADMLGFPLRDTFFKMDWRLAWQIVRGNEGGLHLAVMILALTVAAVVAGIGWGGRK